MNQSGKLSVKMTRSEIIGGWVYLFLFLLIIPAVLQLLQKLAGGGGGTAQLNLVFYIICAIICLVLFHEFLLANINTLFKPFWGSMQAILLGLVMYSVGTYLMNLLINYFFPNLENLNDQQIFQLAAENRTVMLVATIALAPLAEECLFRGVVFQTIYQKSQLSGYIISVVLFGLMHVMNFIGVYSRVEVLMMLLSYVPAGIALAWAYERADSLLAPMIMHCLINFYGMSVALKIPFFGIHW